MRSLEASSLVAAPEEGARTTHAMVFSGGVALGAYHAGAYATLQEETGLDPDWVAGASIGAVTAAIIAGNVPERRSEQLRRFWDGIVADPMPWASLGFGQLGPALPWRQAQGWASATQARLLGRPGLFRPRLFPWAESRTPGLYDLEPLRRRIEEVVDFELLNSDGAPRLSVVATDLSSGERVICDTGRGTRIRPEHVVASCALLPDFAPVEIEGRLLGDGGLSTNTPLDLVLDEPRDGDLVCFVLDLFARDGPSPRSLPAAVARAEDLIFAGQTSLILDGRRREQRLRAMIARLERKLPDELRADPDVASILKEGRSNAVTVLHLAYLASAGEADFQKIFDFSSAALAERWEAGAQDMRAALNELAVHEGDATGPVGLVVHKVRS